MFFSRIMALTYFQYHYIWYKKYTIKFLQQETFYLTFLQNNKL
ncbi:hypothetical protein L1275_001670 [Flavobacterium sp. HSC-61S13]|nr:hypothetical protein [Flavobacterium sp. HSC-61S13]